MDIVTREDLKMLAGAREGPCVSIYQPAHRAGPDTRTYARQDPVRLKNLLREAAWRVLAAGVGARQARALLAPVRRLLDNLTFWRYQSDGLAVFLAPGLCRTFRVPLRFEELVVVADRFHIKPLAALLTGDGLFCVLALSQNEVRLLVGTRDHMSEVELPGAPKSLAEALRYDDPERQLQFHTRTPRGAGKRAAMFHGHGVGIDDAKDNLLRFFQQVNHGVVGLLKGAPAPLVVAGVDYLLPIYREANTHPHLLEEGVPGNPEALRPDELHARAWPLVEPYFLKAREAAAARYLELRDTERAARDVRDVVPAAHHGRVEILFAAVGVRVWGTFDPATGAVEVSEEAPGQTEDLVNLATIHTILNGGTAYAVVPEEMPEETPLAAVFRY